MELVNSVIRHLNRTFLNAFDDFLRFAGLEIFAILEFELLYLALVLLGLVCQLIFEPLKLFPAFKFNFGHVVHLHLMIAFKLKCLLFF